MPPPIFEFLGCDLTRQSAGAPTAGSCNRWPEDEEIHRKAQRFARLLVDEIKLYNQAKVSEGRKNRDLYDRLKEDIDKSLDLSEALRQHGGGRSRYFSEELVRSLAEDDISVMGANFQRIMDVVCMFAHRSMNFSDPLFCVLIAALLCGQFVVVLAADATPHAQERPPRPQKKSAAHKRPSPRLRRMHQAFVASASLKPMARQLLQDRSAAAYAGVEAYARRKRTKTRGHSRGWLRAMRTSSITITRKPSIR